MSTHYLLSVFDDHISDIVSPIPPSVSSEVTGNYVVRVANDVVVRNPVDLSDLITQKYASILATHGLFTQVIFDDLLDASEINAGASTNVILGVKGTNGLLDGGVLQTSPITITWGGPGSGPSQAIMTYEVFQYVDADVSAGRYTRTYEEVDTDVAPITVQVSFDNGATFMAATDKNLINIAVPSQGVNVVLKFTHTNAATGRFFLGSWAVLF